MIEEYLMKQAKEITPELEWTVNYVTGMEATGTVYDTGGSNGDINNDAEIRYPTYQFWIRSSKEDWDLAKKVAYRLYKQFHKKSVDDVVHVPELDASYRVFFMQFMSQPILIGEVDDVMVYSLNLEVTLREES
ncbi:minor capsid protein [Priestia sp. FSL R5-0597]|uniref:minor capsid protein n=1 Tax=Priestia sp. FSL R5-0597 TaxID=2921580 RepID=UPI0030F986EA